MPRIVKAGLSMCALAVCLLAIGCSGLCHVMLHNDLGVAIIVDVTYPDTEKLGAIDHDFYDIGPGGQSDVSLWFGSPAPYLDIAVSAGQKRWKRRILEKELPETIREGSSAASLFHIHIGEGRIAIESTFMDNYSTLVWTLAIVGGVVAISWALGMKMKSTRHPPSLRNI
jgi:hypothetical protein